MKTTAQKLFSVMLSLLTAFMCITTTSAYADYQPLPQQTPKSTSKMIFSLSSTQAISPGDDIQLDINAAYTTAISSIEHVILTIPDGFEFTGMSDYSPMFNGSVSYITSGNNVNISISSDGSVNEGSVVASIYLHVSENCSIGMHNFVWKTTAMSCTTATGNRYSPTFLTGIINVGNSSGGNTTTPTTTTPTTTTTTTTTTTDTETSAVTTETTTTPVITDNADIFRKLSELEYTSIDCDGLPEYKLTDSDGTVYLLNFSSKWVKKSGIAAEAVLPDDLISLLIANKDSVNMQVTEYY